MSSHALLIIDIVMGCVMFALTVSSLVPQIISLRKTRNTSGISWVSNLICFVDNIFWLIWTFGFYFNSMLMYKEPMTRTYQVSLLILVFTYVFGVILSTYILMIKSIHLYKAKKMNVTELELANILLAKDKNKYFINNKPNNFKRYFVPILYIFIDLLISFTVVALLYVFAYIQPIKDTKEWMWVFVLSFACSIIWEAVSWPQLIKSIKEKDTTGISLFWAIFGAVNCIVSFAYDLSLSFATGGFTYNMLFILIFSAIAPNIGVLICKIINVTKAKKAGMSEVEYTKKILIPMVKAKKERKELKNKDN